MGTESLISIIFVLIGIISALVAGHYVSVVWEVRKLRDEIAELREQITSSALAAATAATSAAQVAHHLINGKNKG